MAGIREGGEQACELARITGEYSQQYVWSVACYCLSYLKVRV
ncbi:hypothetical protein Sbal175_2121 [Shewanella baltica BA175]|nr:hypothetical protein Sbal175_2121 [Shewanella baltica BA175]